MDRENMKRWNQISGFFDQKEAEKIQELGKGKICAEIGSFFGRSTTALAEVAKAIYAIDTFRASGDGATQVEGAPHEFTILDGFCANIYGYTNIRICIGRSTEIAGTFSNQFFDLIFIDGSHEYEEVKADIEAWWPKLKDLGIMAFHDYKAWPGVTKAIDEKFVTVQGPMVSLGWVNKI